MLPVLLFDRDEGTQKVLRSVLDQMGDGFKLLWSGDDAREAQRFIDVEAGVILALCGIRTGEESDAGLALAYHMQRRNRDNYLMLIVSDLNVLASALTGSIRVSGILVKPVDHQRACTLMGQLLSEHESTMLPQDDKLTFKVGSTVLRVNPKGLLYVEACNKKLDLWTKRQCFSIYASMSELESALGKDFFRCHRSYLVNRSAVAQADYAAMELKLLDGTRLPISRSQKAALKDWISIRKENSYA